MSYPNLVKFVKKYVMKDHITFYPINLHLLCETLYKKIDGIVEDNITSIQLQNIAVMKLISFLYVEPDDFDKCKFDLTRLMLKAYQMDGGQKLTLPFEDYQMARYINVNEGLTQEYFDKRKEMQKMLMPT